MKISLCRFIIDDLLRSSRLGQLLGDLIGAGGGQTAGCTENDGYQQILGFKHAGYAVECDHAANRTQQTGDQRNKAVELISATQGGLGDVDDGLDNCGQSGNGGGFIESSHCNFLLTCVLAC